MEIPSVAGDLPPALAAAYGASADDPVALVRLAEGAGAEFIFVSLSACHPDGAAWPVARGVDFAKSILCASTLPAIVSGSGDEMVDRDLFPALAEKAPRPIHIHFADEKNYRLVGGSALAYGHGVVSWSPIDINMARQANLLLADIGVPAERIIIDPLTGGLGYGLEYSYSIVERIKLAAAAGDAVLRRPVLCLLSDAWKSREASDDMESGWGDVVLRGKRWEEATGWACLAAGADLLAVRHPDNIRTFRGTTWR